MSYFPFETNEYYKHIFARLQKDLASVSNRNQRIYSCLSYLINSEQLKILNNFPASIRYENIFLSNEKPFASHEKKKGNYMVPLGEHKLPPLPYDYNALEPFIDEQTMILHHDKHHKSYVDGLNKAEIELEKERNQNNFSLVKHWERELAFNGAGHYLHSIFWNNMSPKGGGMPTGEITLEINKVFGNFDRFKNHFTNAASKVEGSGWAALVWSPRAHRVEILQYEKHQNLSQQDMIPLLVIDVWEHAYYLKYQNNRNAYIDAWWNVVNWNYVNRRYNEAKKIKWYPY